LPVDPRSCHPPETFSTPVPATKAAELAFRKEDAKRGLKDDEA
jgi:hypothetical protein